MSTKATRLTKHIANVDSYIKHQMTRKSEAERQAFREKMIRQYDDEIEKYSECLQKVLTKSLPQ